MNYNADAGPHLPQRVSLQPAPVQQTTPAPAPPPSAPAVASAVAAAVSPPGIGVQSVKKPKRKASLEGVVKQLTSLAVSISTDDVKNNGAGGAAAAAAAGPSPPQSAGPVMHRSPLEERLQVNH